MRQASHSSDPLSRRPGESTHRRGRNGVCQGLGVVVGLLGFFLAFLIKLNFLFNSYIPKFTTF